MPGPEKESPRITNEERGTADNGVVSGQPSFLENVRQQLVIEGILGARQILNSLNPLTIGHPPEGASDARSLQATGDYERAFEVATGFEDYFDIHREAGEAGSALGEEALVMLGHAAGFNQAVEAYQGADRSGPLEGWDRFSKAIDAALRIANTALTIAGAVEATSAGVKRGLPFSANRAMTKALEAEAKKAAEAEAKKAAVTPPKAVKAPRQIKRRAKAPKTVPLNSIEIPGAKASEAGGLEETRKAPARGTGGSINSAPLEGKQIQRGLRNQKRKATALPSRKKTARPKTAQKKPQPKAIGKKKADGGVTVELTEKQTERVRRLSEALKDETKWGNISPKDRWRLGKVYDNLMESMVRGIYKTGDYNVLHYVELDAKLVAELRASGKTAVITEGRLRSLGLRFDMLKIDFAKGTAQLIDLAATSSSQHVAKTLAYKNALAKLLNMEVEAIEMLYTGDKGELLPVLKQVTVK